jgi:hypothetical protein
MELLRLLAIMDYPRAFDLIRRLEADWQRRRRDLPLTQIERRSTPARTGL